MAKDKTQGMQRIDLRIPDHIYSEIERIAIYNNLPYSPTTKPNTDGSLKVDKKGNVIQPKVSVSPIILDLINLGLKAIANGEENSDKLGDKTRPIEYQVNNQIDVSDIEKKIINTLTQKIEGIVSDKVNEALSKLTDNFSKLTDIEESNNIELVENKLPSHKEQIVTAESDINEVEISEINQNEDNAQIEINLIDNTANNPLKQSPIVPRGEELGDNLTLENKALLTVDNSGVKSYEEAVIEINRLKKEELGNTAIAKELTGKYYTAKGLTNWSDTQVRRLLS